MGHRAGPQPPSYPSWPPVGGDFEAGLAFLAEVVVSFAGERLDVLAGRAVCELFVLVLFCARCSSGLASAVPGVMAAVEITAAARPWRKRSFKDVIMMLMDLAAKARSPAGDWFHCEAQLDGGFSDQGGLLDRFAGDLTLHCIRSTILRKCEHSDSSIHASGSSIGGWPHAQCCRTQ